MKIKNLIMLAVILTLALYTTAFIQPATAPLEDRVAEGEPFAVFLSQFEHVELPFNIGLDDCQKYQALKKSPAVTKNARKAKKHLPRGVMGKFIPELKTGLYSRMGPPSVEPIARFYPNEKTIAVVYMAYYPFGYTDDMDFRIAVFDFKGNNVTDPEKKDDVYFESLLLGRNSQMGHLAFSIDAEGYIWKNRYKAIWKEDLQTHGIEDNEIICYDLVNTEVFQINKKGHIDTVTAYPTAGRASLQAGWE